MGTYTVITITGPNEDLARVKLHKLPDFEGWDGGEWELVTTQARRVIDKQEGNVILEQHYEHDPIPEHTILNSFNTKWTPEGVAEWAVKFTAKRPTLQVVVREEWDNRDADEPGIDECVYRAGDWVREESKINGEVPYNLVEMLDAAKFALTVNDPVPARMALQALIKGLS